MDLRVKWTKGYERRRQRGLKERVKNEAEGGWGRKGAMGSKKGVEAAVEKKIEGLGKVENWRAMEKGHEGVWYHSLSGVRIKTITYEASEGES